MIGGCHPCLIEEFELYRGCLLVDIEKGSVHIKESMRTGRYGHTAIHLANSVYVVGGMTETKSSTKTCEKYNLKRNSWKPFSNTFDEFSIDISAIGIRNRFIFVFGGRNARS